MRGHGASGYRIKKDHTELQHLYSDTSSHLLPHNDHPELFEDSKLDFLEKQTKSTEQSYKSYLTASIAINVFTILCTITFSGIWFYWLSKFSSDSLICYNLKTHIIWAIVIYMIGIFSHIFGIIVGWARLSTGFFVYQGVLALLMIFRIGMDIQTLNGATQYLDGCTEKNTGVSFHYYIYATIGYCILIAVLFTCNISLIYALRKAEKAKKIKQEYITKIGG